MTDIATMFTRSPEVAEFRAHFTANQIGGRKTRVEFGGVNLRSLVDNQATSGGAFQNPDRVAVVPQYGDRMPQVLDLVSHEPTDANTVEYIRETTAAGGGAAAETAEGSAKTETTYTFEIITSNVRTVAHWVNVTRQTLEDSALLAGHVRSRLVYGARYRLDNQIVNGDGTGVNLRGILNTSGINAYAPATPEARVISIRKAMTLCYADQYAPTAVLVHPTDDELIDLSTADDASFRVGPSGLRSLWGLLRVVSTVIAAGTGIVGDFQLGATVWDREQPSVEISFSHASNFVSNIGSLLCELRAAFTVWRPEAFCKITYNGSE